jgi:DNA repair protein RecO (recombination protein O)
MERQLAFVLHTRPYRETSQLVELFCAGVGRQTLVARGSRSARSPLKALLQPFTPLSVSWRGKGELKSLEQLEVEGPPLQLREVSLYSALYLNELLYYLLERQTAYHELFDYYRQALQLLTMGGSPEPVLRQFELLLLEALGYGLDFSTDALSGLPIEPQLHYLYRAEYGFVQAPGNGSGMDRYEGRHLVAMGAGCLQTADELLAAKRFCRQALKPYLGNRPLKSRELFQHLSARKMQ